MATGDILSVTIPDKTTAGQSTDGWYADVVVEGLNTGGTYAWGLGTNNADTANAKFVMTVVSEGYNSAGTLGTVTRTVYGTRALRKAYPNHANLEESYSGGNVTIRVALSDFVYDDDNTGAGKSGTAPTVSIGAGWYTQGGTPNNACTNLTVTNNSTLDYPQVIGQWDNYAGVCTADRVKSDFAVAFNARHRFGVSCVRFDATGQTSAVNVNSTVTSETATQRSATSLYLSAHKATIAISGFTQGELITLRCRAYPVVGDADSIIDTNGRTTLADECIGYNDAVVLCDKNNSLDDAVYVSTSGNDTTGDGSSGNPYATIAKGMKEGNIVYLAAGTHAAVGSTQTRKSTSEWVIVQPAPGESSASVTVQIDATNRNFRCSRMQYKNVTLKLVSTTSWLDGEDLDNCLRIVGCVFDGSGVATPGTFPLGYRADVTYIQNCTGDLGHTEWFMQDTSQRIAFWLDGCMFGGGTLGMRGWRRVTACKSTTAGVGFIERSTGNTSPVLDNWLFENNAFYNAGTAGLSVLTAGETNQISRGASIVGNVVEKTTGTNGIFIICSNSNGILASNNVLFVHNTAAGERCNIAYNATGSTAINHTNWLIKYNAWRDYNIKSDTFTTANAGRIGNWPVLYGVGFWGNRYELANFPNDFAGIDTAAVGDDGIAYVDNASYTGDGTGAGDYTPTSTSVIVNRIPAGGVLQSHDLNGTARAAGSGDAGAIELVTGNPWYYYAQAGM